MNGTTTTSVGEGALSSNNWESLTSWAVKLLSCAILLGGVATVGLTAYVVVVSYTNIPHWDGWSQIEFGANAAAQSTFDWLWTQHNQHRLVIPRLFLLADLRWFQGTQVFLLASIFVIQLLHLTLLSWSMRVFAGWRGSPWRTGVGLAAFCLFCPSQWENFTWGFQTCFVLPGFFATVSWIGLLLYWLRSGKELGRHSSWKYLLLSIIAALGSTYSLSNGNLLWPLLVAAALLLRLRLAAVLSFAIVGAVSTGAYLNNYYRPSSFPPSAGTLLQMFKYLTVYFGSSWVYRNVHAAELIGAAGLVVLLFLLLRLPSYVHDRRPFPIQLVLTLLFCLGTGMVTALARLVFGIPQAFSSRYQTVALLFWCCMGLLLLGRAFSFGQTRNVDSLLVQAILLSIMLFAASRARIPIANARLEGFQHNVAAMALVTGAPDREQLQWADSHPDYVLSLVPYMRKQRLSVFSGTLPSLLGKPLDSMFSLASPDECTGQLESATALTGTRPQSLRITGWVWDYKHRQLPAEIVAATNGVVTGLGAVGDWRPTVRKANPNVTSNYTGFAGYVSDVRESIPVNIYAILFDRTAAACLIATLTDASHSAH